VGQRTLAHPKQASSRGENTFEGQGSRLGTGNGRMVPVDHIRGDLRKGLKSKKCCSSAGPIAPNRASPKERFETTGHEAFQHPNGKQATRGVKGGKVA